MEFNREIFSTADKLLKDKHCTRCIYLYISTYYIYIYIYINWLYKHFLPDFLVNLDVDITSSLFYLPIAQFWHLIVIGRDSGLSTLCHSSGFTCQQR